MSENLHNCCLDETMFSHIYQLEVRSQVDFNPSSAVQLDFYWEIDLGEM